MTRASATLLVIVVLAVVWAGCGSSAPDVPMLSIDQAVKAEPGSHVKVEGHLLATDQKALLASALLESYPPQPGGATITLADLDTGLLVGLSSTAGQPDFARVTWSDFPVVLEGTVKDGVLAVEKTPPVVDTATAEVRVRFSPTGGALMGGGPVWWVFDVTNLTSAPLPITFPTGQMGEVVLSREGAELYRWSDGRSFIQAMTVDALQPGVARAIVLNDQVALTPGVYDVVAKVTAATGPEGSSVPLPEIVTTITVR